MSRHKQLMRASRRIAFALDELVRADRRRVADEIARLPLELGRRRVVGRLPPTMWRGRRRS